MRQSPVKHQVKSHYRKSPKYVYGSKSVVSVRSYTRGKGAKNQKLANPVPGYTHPSPVATARLLKKLDVPEWYGWGPEFNDMPPSAKKAILVEYRREQKIINQFRNDPAKMQAELILDHAKRIVDSGKYQGGPKDRPTHEQDVAWNTAVQNCKYQYKRIEPFSRELDLTEEYMNKLEKYAKQVQDKRKKRKVQFHEPIVKDGYDGEHPWATEKIAKKIVRDHKLEVGVLTLKRIKAQEGGKVLLWMESKGSNPLTASVVDTGVQREIRIGYPDGTRSTVLSDKYNITEDDVKRVVRNQSLTKTYLSKR